MRENMKCKNNSNCNLFSNVIYFAVDETKRKMKIISRCSFINGI